MAQNISPGVYTKIIDLSQYLQDIPGTFGFCPVLTKRGPDNQLVFIGNGKDFRSLFGKPDISIFGQQYGQGPYIVHNHLSIATSCYVMRALPEEATYANLFLALQLVDSASSSGIDGAEPNRTEIVGVSFGEDGTNTMDTVQELDSMLIESTITDWVTPSITGGTGYNDGFLCYFRPIGRGDSYNDFAIQIERHANPAKMHIYVLEIYEKQSDGDVVLVESFEVSFEPTAKDSSGESLYIEDVVNRFSEQIRCKVNPRALEVLAEAQAEFHKNEEEETYPDNPYVDDTNIVGYKQWKIDETKLELTNSETELSDALIELSNARKMPQTTTQEIEDRNVAVEAAIDRVSLARQSLTISKQNYEDALLLDILITKDTDKSTFRIDPVFLKNGSDGSLWRSVGANTGKVTVDTQIADMILAQAYSGLLINPETAEVEDKILDTDDIWIDLVYDAGYSDNVKWAAHNLSELWRRDCMTILDNGDNNNLKQALAHAKNENGDGMGPLNSRYVARYEGYTTIFDVWTGKDINVSPVFHMARVIPMVDKEYELWYAPAGFNRATLSDVKSLRWSPKLGERDQLYLNQLNPIVKFNVGYTVWGQLTTQKRPSALQDVNIMRLVLYIKRALEQYLKFFIFEFNDQQTWDQISGGITPFLEMIRKKRGLKSFEVEVGATDYEFKQKICHVNVILEPMRVIEKIELNLYVK